MVPRPSLNRFIFDKASFHETSAGVVSGASPGFFASILNRFRFRIWPPKWSPGGAQIAVLQPLGGSKTVLKSSWFGSLVVLSFGIAFLVVLGSSWGRFWSSWAPLRVFFGRSGGRFGAFSAFQLIDSTCQLINSSIRLINSSTHQPLALRHFLTRPGGLRAARLNNFLGFPRKSQ